MVQRDRSVVRKMKCRAGCGEKRESLLMEGVTLYDESGWTRLITHAIMSFNIAPIDRSAISYSHIRSRPAPPSPPASLASIALRKVSTNDLYELSAIGNTILPRIFGMIAANLSGRWLRFGTRINMRSSYQMVLSHPVYF